MIQDAIAKLDPTIQPEAKAAVILLMNLGVFESQSRINTERLVDGSYGERMDVLASRIQYTRAQRDALDALQQLGKTYDSEA